MQKKNIITFLALLFLAIPASSQGAPEQAAETQIAWPPSPMGTNIGPNTLFHELIQYLYEWGISLGGIAVFVMLVWAGIEYLTSAGDPGKMGVAMKKIRSSILGLVLLLTSWLILNTINPQLVQLRPLPILRDERGFRGLEGDLLPGLAPPCDVIVVYPEVDFKGKRVRPDGTTTSSPLVFLGKASPDEDVLDVYRIEGKGNIDRYAYPSWASARGLVWLTDETLKNNPGIIRYNEKGEKDNNGFLVEGGFCMIDVFQTSKRWLTDVPCGSRLGRAILPIRDISEIRFRDETITCIEASRTIPRMSEEERKAHEEKLKEEEVEGQKLVLELWYELDDSQRWAMREEWRRWKETAPAGGLTYPAWLRMKMEPKREEQEKKMRSAETAHRLVHWEWNEMRRVWSERVLGHKQTYPVWLGEEVKRWEEAEKKHNLDEGDREHMRTVWRREKNKQGLNYPEWLEMEMKRRQAN